MIESCYGLTDCPKCGELVAIVFSPEWIDAQYLCCRCSTAFMFKLEDEQGDVDG